MRQLWPAGAGPAGARADKNGVMDASTFGLLAAHYLPGTAVPEVFKPSQSGKQRNQAAAARP